MPELPKSLEPVGETLEDDVSTVKGKVSIAPDGTIKVTRPDGTELTIGECSVNLNILLSCFI